MITLASATRNEMPHELWEIILALYFNRSLYVSVQICAAWVVYMIVIYVAYLIDRYMTKGVRR